MLSLYGFSQSTLYGPATLQSHVHRFIVDPRFDSQVLQAEGFTLERQKDGCSPVASLLSWSCPSAIFREIALRAIYSVNGVRRGWSRTHIRVEVLKRLPSSAYCDAVLPIAMERLAVLVVAAFLHFLPRTVFWCAFHAVLFLIARFATTATIPSQCGSVDRLFYSALAPAVPVGMRRWMVCCLTNDRPFTEPFPGQVFESISPTSRISVSHDFVPLKQVVVRTALALQRLGCLYFNTSVVGEASHGS